MRKLALLTGFLAVGTILLATTIPVQAEGDEFKACARCHGVDGNSKKAKSPSISSLNPAYAEAALKAYRAGERECGQMALKCKSATKMTDEEIAGGAAHFAQFDRVPPDQPFDSALAEQGKSIHEEHCAECHSAGAQPAEGEPPAGILTGQWREYLQYALAQYASGARQQPDKMRAAVESLEEGQLDALLNYYASGQ